MTSPKLRSITIDQALVDPKLLGAALGPVGSWTVWIAILRAAFGLELTESELSAFQGVSGGREPPKERVRELWAIIGRRAGKSRMAAALATFIAAFVDHTGKLAPGEVGTVLVLAASKTQAQTVFRYVVAFFEQSAILKRMVDTVTTDEIRLHGGISIAVHTNSFRTVRGRTLLAAIFDEVGFWRDETTSSPDVETYRAVLPALSTTNGMLFGISSPYAQRGLLYSKHQSSFASSDKTVLVVQAGTKIFNPTLDTSIIDQAFEEDPESASAEWEAQFRGDLSTFVERAVVERCVDPGVREVPPDRKVRYVAFCDPSGGVHDSMTLGIGHRVGDTAVLDCLREVKPPFAPEDVVGEFVKVLQAYGVRTVTGDRYAGTWVSDAFKRHGIRYVPSERNRSEIYLDALPLLMSGRCMLLDDTRLVGQIAQLERRTSRMGRDSIDHMRGASDDLCNAALGAITHVPDSTKRKHEDGFAPHSRQVRVVTANQDFKDRLRGRKNKGSIYG